MTGMNWNPLALVFAVVFGGIAIAEEPQGSLCESWNTEYAGEDATAEQTIGLWSFNKGAETEDASGHGHTLKLQGAAIHPSGRFGACLESFPGWPVEDKRHAAVVANHAALSPKGAFTLELWICPKPELKGDYPSRLAGQEVWAEMTINLSSERPTERVESLRARLDSR